MDNQAYLDQITASARPQGGKLGNSLFSPLFIKLMIGAAILLVLIIIFGSILGSINNKPEELSKQLSMRITNVSETIETYNPSVQSAKLRSLGSAMKSSLGDTQTALSSFLEKTYNYKKADEKSDLYKKEASFIEETNNTLEHAKLNAYLDRIYVQQLSHQIDLIISIESEIYTRSGNDDLKNIVSNSAKSLGTLQENIDSTAETIK